jgi:recombination protein RecA
MYGPGSIMRLDAEAEPVESISTGSIALDRALGTGGLPRGRLVEIYGQEMSGKTTIALHVVANAQRAGGVCAFIDAEHCMDPPYAERLGVTTAELLVSQPDNGEQGLEIADTLVKSGGITLLVIDSVAALVPRAELEGDMGDAHMGLHARLMGAAMRKLGGAAHHTNTTIIFINQLRMNIGNMGFGSPYVTTGGKALKFYASVRLDVKKIETLKNSTEAYGQRNKVIVAKNKLAPPFKTAEFDIIWGEGISRESELLDLGVTAGIITKSGTWFKYRDEQLGQGKENARLRLKEDPALACALEQAIEESYAT